MSMTYLQTLSSTGFPIHYSSKLGHSIFDRFQRSCCINYILKTRITIWWSFITSLTGGFWLWLHCFFFLFFSKWHLFLNTKSAPKQKLGVPPKCLQFKLSLLLRKQICIMKYSYIRVCDEIFHNAGWCPFNL